MKHNPKAASALSAGQLLTNVVGQNLTRYQSPSQVSARILRAVLNPDECSASSHPVGGLDPQLERELIACGALFDTSRLKVGDEIRIEAFLRERVGAVESLLDKLADLLGLERLENLSKESAKLATLCPDTVRLALAGCIGSAIRSVPLGGCRSGILNEWTEQEVLDLITSIARYHLLIALVRAGEAAFQRCFRPTGMAVLDGQPDRRATTEQHVARTIAWNAGWMRLVMDLYDKARRKGLTPEEVARLSEDEALVAEAERWREELERIFGERMPVVVHRCHRLARLWTRRIGAEAARAAAAAAPNATMYAKHGTEPLAMLWLACSMAMAWLRVCNGQSALDRAVDAVRQGWPVPKPPFPIRSDQDGRQLFFLIQNAVARHPKSHAVIAAGPDGDLTAAIEELWDKQMALHAGMEPFSTSATRRANAAYRRARAKKDIAFLDEVDGLLWRQIHL